MSASSSVPVQYGLLLSGRVASALLQAATLVLFARFSDVISFGVTMAFVGVTSLGVAIADLGMGSLVVREAARKNFGLVLTSLRLNVLSQLSLILAIVVALCFLGNSDMPILYMLVPLGMSLAIEKYADVRLGIALADGSSGVVTIGLISRRLVTLVVLLSLIFLKIEPVLSYSIGALSGAIAAVAYAHKFVEVPRATLKPARNVISASTPYWFNSMAAQLRNLDVTIVSFMSSATQAASYSVASRIVGPFQLFVTSAASIVLPTASRQKNHEKKRTFWIILGVSIIAGLCYTAVALTAYWWVPLLLGEAYSFAVLPVAIVTLGLIPMSYSEVAKATLQGWGSASQVAYVSVCTGIMLVLAISLGSAINGAIGAAIAFSIIFSAQSVAYAILLLRASRES